MQLKNGIYHLTNEEYHALPAISSSHLVIARDALRKFWWDSPHNPKRPENPETKALRIGRAMHTFLLEPERFAKEYRVAPHLEDHPDALVYMNQLLDRARVLGINTRGMRKSEIEDNLVVCDPESKIWSWMLQEFEMGAKSGLYTPISKEDKLLVTDMAEALADEVIHLEGTDDSFTMREVFEVGVAEETYVWQEPATGLWLKVRLDWRLGEHLIFEYRTARDASDEGFTRDVRNRNYHLRAGMYHHVAQQIREKQMRFIYVAQEKEAPFLSNPIEQTTEDLEAGWTLCLHLLTQIKACLDKGDPADKRNWPGYCQGTIGKMKLSDHSMTV